MKSISALMRDYATSPEQKPLNDDWNVGKLKPKNHWGKGSYGGTAGPIEEESGEPASIPDVTSLSKKSCERADVRFPLPLLLLSSNGPSQLTPINSRNLRRAGARPYFQRRSGRGRPHRRAIPAGVLGCDLLAAATLESSGESSQGGEKQRDES